MINLGEEQSLGLKALIIVLARNFFIGLFFVFISAIIILLKSPLISGISKLLSVGNLPGSTISNTPSAIIMLISIIFFCLGVIVFLIGALISYLKHISYSFTLNQFDLVIKTGIITKKQNAILYRQIRDVNIERSLLYQFFGLSKIDIITSETDARSEEGISKIYIDYLDSEAAQEVMDIITKKVGVPILETQVR